MKYFIITVLAVLVGLVAGLVRLLIFQKYKGTIEFDGPALLSFWLAIAGGIILFTILGIVLIVKKKF